MTPGGGAGRWVRECPFHLTTHLTEDHPWQSTIQVPLEQAPWGDSFGMLSDKYGVDWLVNVAGAKPAE